MLTSRGLKGYNIVYRMSKNVYRKIKSIEIIARLIFEERKRERPFFLYTRLFEKFQIVYVKKKHFFSLFVLSEFRFIIIVVKPLRVP